jgi:tetratricopeptide (TPR) repeat protein
MSYILPCDFSADQNPIHCIIAALEMKCNAPHLFSEFGVNLSDLQDAFAFIPDQEIIIECYQTSVALNLDTFCAQLNNGKSKKKFTLIKKTEPYLRQAEIRRHIESDCQNIMAKLPNDNFPDYQHALMVIQQVLDATPLSLNHRKLYHELKIVYKMGEVFEQKMRFDNALGCYERAITLCESQSACESNHLNHLNLIFLMLKKAQIFSLKSDYHSAQKIYEALLPKLSSVLYEHDIFLINIKIIHINTYIRQEKIDLAVNDIVSLKNILPGIINSTNHYTHAMLLSYLGLIYSYHNNQLDALRLLQSAITYFEKSDQPENYYYALSLLEVSKSDISKGDFVNADFKSRKAFQILHNLREVSTMLRETYKIGILFLEKNQFDYAMPYFEQAKIVLEKMQIENPSISLAQVLNEIAFIHSKKDRIEQALATYIESFQVKPNANVMIIIINLHIRLNHLREAMNCLQNITPLVRENSPEAEEVKNLTCIIYSQYSAQMDENCECQSEKTSVSAKNNRL